MKLSRSKNLNPSVILIWNTSSTEANGAMKINIIKELGWYHRLTLQCVNNEKWKSDGKGNNLHKERTC